MHLVSVFYDSTLWVRISEMFANTQSLHSVIRPNCYSHSCTLPGQLFVQQHNKLDQCPDPAGEAVVSFVPGCCFFVLVFLCFGSGFLVLCFVAVLFFVFFFYQLHICISTCHDADKRRALQKGQRTVTPIVPWKQSLKSINAKTMLFLCCWFHTCAFSCALVSVVPSELMQFLA